MTNPISRRNFLKSASAVTAGTMIIPNLISCSPNSKVNIAVIGVGGQGLYNWPRFINKNNPGLSENIVAMCDVNEVAAAEGFEAVPKAKKFSDFRVMLDKMHKNIDAVMICTPDHVHFAATMAAMQMGKHVYTEKPLAHNIWQLRTLKKAASYYNVISQMGNQGHASDGIRRVKEWTDSGITGDVHEIHAWFGGPRFNSKGYFLKPNTWPPAAEMVPDTLNWDLWLGPVSERPYSSFYLPRYWRGWYDFGNAELGDWACHTLDAPYWALDLGTPTAVEPIFAKQSPLPNDFVTDQSVLRFEFPQRGNKPPVVMNWYEGGIKPENRPEWLMDEMPGNGMIMVGDKMSVRTGGRPDDSQLVLPQNEWEAYKANPPAPIIPRIRNESPQFEWIDAIKGNGPMPGSSFDYAAGLTEMALVGVLAQRFNKRIEFDAQSMQITNYPELNRYIKEPVRKGWEYGEDL